MVHKVNASKQENKNSDKLECLRNLIPPDKPQKQMATTWYKSKAKGLIN